MSPHPSPVESDFTTSDWRDIEELLDEVGLRARTGMLAGDYYRLLFDRLLPLVGATAAAVWMRTGGDSLRLEFQRGLLAARDVPQRDQLTPHHGAVARALGTGQPHIVKLSAQGEGEPAGMVLVQPFATGDRLSGAVEMVASAEMTGDRNRSYQRILKAIVELVEEFHRHRELVELRCAADRWRSFDHFAQQVHRQLDVDATAYAVANEARRVIECDRVSVLLTRSRQMRATAISGVDVIERRSKVVRALERLATRAATCGEPIWYHDRVCDLPDEIAQPLEDYLEESQPRVLALVPLFAPADDSDKPPRVIGVLVAEHFQSLPDAEPLRGRVAAISGHAALALHNAVNHSRLPLARLGRLLAKTRWLAEPRQLPKTVVVLAVIAAVGAALTFVPADFTVEATGELQPLNRRDVFASDDGVVNELLIDSDRAVQAGEPLLVLRKAELELETHRVLGEMQTVEKKLASIRAERLQDAPAGDERRRDPHELAADEAELNATLTGLVAQQAVLAEQQQDLTIRSPIDGQAITWNIEQLLASRPVQRGQALLTVADLDGPWVLELHVADDRAGYVLAARDELQPGLDVDFVLASNPGQHYQGRVTKVSPVTEVDVEGKPTVLVTVSFDKMSVPALRPGATAVAKIQCGTRSLGYVWLHDVYDYVQSLWW